MKIKEAMSKVVKAKNLDEMRIAVDNFEKIVCDTIEKCNKQCIENKVKICARVMTLGEFNELKGWNEASCFNQQGYMIIYSDGTTTWTTKEIYEKGMK